jgi:hypothetical protein
MRDINVFFLSYILLYSVYERGLGSWHDIPILNDIPLDEKERCEETVKNGHTIHKNRSRKS